MPVIKSAIKKLRKDRKREGENRVLRAKLDVAIRQAKKASSTPGKSGSKVKEAYSIIDRAVKRNIIHKNKAARIKSSLAKLASPESSRKAKLSKQDAQATPKKANSKTLTNKTKSKPAKSAK